MNKKLFAICFGLLALAACKEPVEEKPVVPTEPELPEIVLTAPEDGVEYDLNNMSEVFSFGWTEVEEFSTYRLHFSLDPYFETYEEVAARTNPTTMGIAEMDELLGLLGLPEAKSAYLYWRVAPTRSLEYVCNPFRMFVNRLDPNTRMIIPADGLRYNLNELKDYIEFEWRTTFGATKHIFQISLTDDFEEFFNVMYFGANDTRAIMGDVTMDYVLEELGAEPGCTCDVYWRIQPQKDGANLEPYTPRKLVIDRLNPRITPVAPKSGEVVDLSTIESLTFSWNKAKVGSYIFEIGLDKEFEVSEQVKVGNKTSYTMTAEELNAWGEKGSQTSGQNVVLYWRLLPVDVEVMVTVMNSQTQVLVVKVINNDVELISPMNASNYSCNSCDEIFFQWSEVEGISEYDIEFSLDEDFLDKQVYNLSDGENDPTSEYLSVDYLDSMLQELGVESEQSALLYWRVVPLGNYEGSIPVRRMTIERKDPALFLPYEERLFDQKMTIYVEALIEDPIVYHEGVCDLEDGKLLHEVTTIHGNRWYDPMEQIYEMEAAIEEAAHGLIDFKITKVHHLKDFGEPNELPFSYYIDDRGNPADENGNTLPAGAEKVTLKYDKYREWCEAKDVPGLGDRVTYDYIKMLTDPNLKTDGMTIAERVDAGLVQEVWIYGGPVSGMNESKLIGDGAFWCNSTGLTKEMGAPCDKLVCVMGGNFERSTDLAVHCWGHRFESIMSHVYGDFKQFYENRYDQSQLNNWERFCGYKMNFGNGKFPDQKGYAHIGFCHFPPNGEKDYDYYLESYFYTYADEWLDYPRLRQNKRKARKVNREEWKYREDVPDPYQMGYMIWYLGHMPHFKGLNMADGHLNNWWYYMVDIKGALEYEKQLREELGWKDKID